jgi:hypothetical protein
MSDPEPVDPFIDFSSQRSIMFTGADGPEIAQPLEVQRGVTRIRLEEGKVLVSQRSNFGGQRFI